MKCFHYTNDTYKTVTYLCIGSPRKLIRYLNKKHKYHGMDSEDFSNTVGKAFIFADKTGRHGGQVVWLRHFTGDVESIVNLSHECLHIAIMSLTCRDVVPIRGHSSEVLNYYQDALLRAFLSRTTKHKNRNKNKWRKKKTKA